MGYLNISILTGDHLYEERDMHCIVQRWLQTRFGHRRRALGRETGLRGDPPAPWTRRTARDGT